MIAISTHPRIIGFFAALLPILVGVSLLTACDRPDQQVAAALGMPDNYSMAAGMILSRPAPGLLANDSATTGKVSARLAGQPGSGTVTLEADGAFRYEPNWRFTGYDSFSYQIVAGEEVSAPIAVRISPPNVLVILVDDIGQGDIGAYAGQVIADTPNLDALAAAGITFNQAHSPAAVCSPSRYSILTGNYPYRGRLCHRHLGFLRPATMIVPGQSTLGRYIQ